MANTRGKKAKGALGNTLRETIRERGISYETLRAAIDAGELKAVKLGRAKNSRIYVQPSDVDAWIESRRLGTDAA